ncbi:MAG: hydroxyacylglutathione hydrolase [Planctomycetes bacterium]|nr:hydroxyacylglutathione hydrolase [Planctomycetota bacterium]
MDKLTTIPAFYDNYIYLYRYDSGRALVVDPGQGSGALKAAEDMGLSIGAILVTHHHADHCGGIESIVKAFGCDVYGADKRIHGLTKFVNDAQKFTLGDVKVKAIATPGHTAGSVCYYMTDEQTGEGFVFTGDTLFTGGCGRVFESDMATMYESLCRLSSLPDETIVYSGHNYTAENYRFASTVEPQNKLIEACLEETLRLEKHGKPFVTNIEKEKQTNIFLLGGAEDFAKLRKNKDTF